METLEKIKASVTGKTQVVSFAPKISMEKITSLLTTRNVARMIPKATSYLNEGYNPLAFSTCYSSSKKQSLLELLKTMGKTFEVEEAKLEAYPIVLAMLPTYFWFQWREMQNLGLQMGLNESETNETVQQT